jgi:hypothetical protein
VLKSPRASRAQEKNTMKKHLAFVALAAAAFLAQAADKELTPQQKLMGTCSKEATGLKGDERKQKMSACLSDGKKRQQEVMKSCNAANKGKKGDEYKKAQKECMSKA